MNLNFRNKFDEPIAKLKSKFTSSVIPEMKLGESFPEGQFRGGECHDVSQREYPMQAILCQNSSK